MGQQLAGAVAEDLLSQPSFEDVDFRALVEHAADGILVLDTETLCFLYVNPALAEMLGYEPDELIGRPVEDVIASECLARAPIPRAALEPGQLATSERILVRRDGTALLAEIRTRRARSGVYQAIVRDVTEARDRERKVERQSAALSERVKELRCLYAVSELLASSKVSYQEVVDQMPAGWQHADVAAVRLSLADRVYASPGFRETPWSQSELILVDGQIAGEITVAYLAERREESGAVFLEEERDLLAAIAARMADALRRQRLADAFARREAYYRTLAEKATDLVLVTDPEGFIRYVSPSIEHLLGFRPEDTIGTRGRELLHPEDMEEAQAVREELVRRPNAVKSLRYRVRHRDGNWRVFEAIARNLIDDPLIRGIVVNGRDVTDRVRAERALRESERRFRALLENVADVITVLDGEGNVKYTSTNGEFEVLQDERRPFDTVHPDDRPEAEENLRRLSERPGATFSQRLRVRGAEGEWRTVEALSRNLLEEPSVRGIVVTTRDVTERVHLETQLRHAQKMEAIGRLAGGVAHDFNNILTAITGFSAVALSSLSPDDPVREDVAEIERGAERAAALTRKLLTFSRRQVLQPEIIDVGSAVQEMERTLRRLIGEHIELVSEIESPGNTVRIDAGQLEQVIMNLAVNARDAMPEGGKLSLRVSEVSVTDKSEAAAVDSVSPGRYAVMEVEDTGSGIDEETVPLIFEPFFTTKSDGQGTGLGLSTVFGIVRQSGGFVAVRSQVGRGTLMRIYIPRASERAPSQSGAFAAASEQEKGTVLVAEDEERVRRLIRRVLQKAGYRVIEAEDGLEALELFQSAEEEIDLLLTDLVMPRLNGAGLVEKLREERPELPCLFMSGYAGDAPAAAEISASDVDFLSKPFGPDQILERVARALRRSARES